jgi:acyl carrier protein
VLQALEILMQSSAVEVGVVPIHWTAGMPQHIKSPFFADLVIKAELEEKLERRVPSREADLLPKLQQSSLGDRYSLLIAYLQQKVGKAFGLNSSQVDPQQPLNNMGLDSLMAVELRNAILSDLKVEIPIEKFLEGCNLLQLNNFLLEQLALESLMSSENSSPDQSEAMEEFTL